MDSVHNAEYYPVSLEELGGWLQFQMFHPVDLTFRNRPIKEWVFERPYLKNHVIRVYTGIERYGLNKNQSRKVGKDAIRVQAVYRPPNGKDTLVNNQKRVHRVTGWKDNLKSRIVEILRKKPQVVLDSRGIPMVLRTNKYDGSKFWGSRDYPRSRETKPFAADWSGMSVLGGIDEIPDMLRGRRETKNAEENPIKKLLAILTEEDWEDIEWVTDEPPQNNPEGWGTDVEWEAETNTDDMIWNEDGGVWYDPIIYEQNNGDMNIIYRIFNEELDYVGRAQIDLTSDKIIISSIVIDAPYQRKGYASDLVAHSAWFLGFDKTLHFSDAVSMDGQSFINSFSAEEIKLKQYDDTMGRKYRDIDEQIAHMLETKSKINHSGDMGCPKCEEVDLFEAKITEKGRAYHCWWCGYEKKIETVKARGDITLEKFGLLVICPNCNKEIKAYNQSAFNRHLKKCRAD